MSIRLRAVCIGMLLVAATMEPASAETRYITLTGTGSAVATCADGGPLPCDTAYRLVYAGDVVGSPFTEMIPRRDAVLVGYLDVPAQGFDPTTSCYAGAMGVFELHVRRGARTVLAFAEPVSGTYCNSGSGGNFTSAYSVDSSNTEDVHFRDAAGSGVVTLQDSLDLSAPTSGVFSRDDQGTITTRR